MSLIRDLVKVRFQTIFVTTQRACPLVNQFLYWSTEHCSTTKCCYIIRQANCRGWISDLLLSARDSPCQLPTDTINYYQYLVFAMAAAIIWNKHARWHHSRPVADRIPLTVDTLFRHSHQDVTKSLLTVQLPLLFVYIFQWTDNGCSIVCLTIDISFTQCNVLSMAYVYSTNYETDKSPSAGHAVSTQVGVPLARKLVERYMSRRQPLGAEGWRLWAPCLPRRIRGWSNLFRNDFQVVN